MRLLIIEDSERLRRSLALGLKRSGFAVDAAADGEEGLAFAEINAYEAIVLDLMLPKIDGLEVLRRLRQQGNPAHVLILSALDRVADRIRGLDLGADDYLDKPFAFEELVARLRALVRRHYGEKDPIIRCRHLELDTAAKSLRSRGRAVALTPLEYSLLELLLRRRGRVLSQTEIQERLYDASAEIASNVVEVLVSTLRRKIQLPGSPSLIVTRRGQGYLIEAD
ncbi:MAG TPA: response regulator transcription factor [Thermoanaerobaculia bacterium]|nr:response regulator transcription factor [Thermoanaerobaculia bacterium]